MWGAILGTAASVGLDLYKNHQATEHADFWNQQNIALQKEFAQNSIKWRVEDAKRAGVHPMAALGIQGSSFSPVSTSIPTTSDSSYLADMGQNVDRAIMAGKDQAARRETEDIQRSMNLLQLEKAGLENDMLRSQIASLEATRHSALPPPAPAVEPRKIENAGQPDTPAVVGGYSGAVPLFTLARHGRTFLDVVNPDIGDSISESAIDSARAKIAGEFEAQKGYVKPPLEYLDKSEREDIKAGKLEMRRTRLGWELVDTPQERLRKIRKKYGTTERDEKFFKAFEDYFNRIRGYIPF